MDGDKIAQLIADEATLEIEAKAKDATIERLLREVGDPDGGNIDEFWLTTHDGFDWMERLAAALEEEKDE